MSEIPASIEQSKPLDLLNRQEFVSRFVRIADVLARNKKSVCYAINGSWGVGKSFVLDMIEEEASLSDYWIFRYNCWEHDYYDEPLVAIVASMIEAINKKTRIVQPETKKKLVEILKIIGRGALKKGGEVIEEKTGVKVNEIANIVTEGVERAEQEIAEAREYDQYYPLKDALGKFQTQIKELAESYPVMFIVDELDRCLPEYAIKVLERLHHMFYGISNVQVVLSVDKGQLEHTVRQIFGMNTDVNRYLAKFISFELNLPEGTFTDEERWCARFSEFISKFDYKNKETHPLDVADFKNNVFSGLDMRARIAIIDKCLLIHDLLIAEDTVLDSAYMCIEILLAIVSYVGVDVGKVKKHFVVSNPFPLMGGSDTTAGLLYLSQKYPNSNNQYKYYSSDQGYHYVYIGDIWGIVLAAYRCAIGIEKDKMLQGSHEPQTIRKHAIDFWNLLQLMC